MTDVSLKFTQAVETKEKKASTVVKVLEREMFVRFGIHSIIHSDQGRNLKSQLVKGEAYSMNSSRRTAYHPQGNGQAERFNRNIHLLRTISI